jgi:hypothetical protein
MSRSNARRVSQLEKLVSLTAEERERRKAALAEWRRSSARDHAMSLVALILHGDPHVDEPLEIAWHRALEQLGLERFGLDLMTSAHAAARLRPLVLPELPGDSENAKLGHVLNSGPTWLIKFCHAWMDANLLGIELQQDPDFRVEFGRIGIREGVDTWPDLPKGTLAAGGPLPPSPFDVLSSEESIDLLNLFEKGEESWSRGDRRRHIEIMTKVDTGAPLNAGENDPGRGLNAGAFGT